MDRVKALLEGGQTKRFHTMPTHQPYDVAQHSWRMLVLLYALNPNPTLRLVWAITFHDVAERWVGDVPATAKWSRQQLRYAVHDAERIVEYRLNIPHGLCDDEAKWLHALDLCELYLTCLDEREMGNRNVDEVARLCRELLLEESPEPVRQYIERITQWTRTSDRFCDD